MKNRIQYSASFLTAGLCLLFCLLANHARATLNYWDPAGSTTGIVYVDLSGSWESALWSTSATGQATGQAWSESYVAACFGVGTGEGTPPFTVTLNGNHTCAGIFDGALTPKSCDVTVAGTGPLTIDYPGGTPAHFAAFDIATSSDGSIAYVRMNVPMTGAGILCAEGGSAGGGIWLNTNNTYTGGTALGYSGASFFGVIDFNNSASFGTGPILVTNSTGSALVLDASVTTALTVTNAWNIGAANQRINLVGNPAGLTFSGPWSLNANTVVLGSSGSGNLVVLSGVMSGGAGGLTCSYATTSGLLELTAINTYTGATTVTNGVLQLGDGTAKNGNVAGNIAVTTPGSLVWANPTALTYTKVISGVGPVTYQGPGALTLSGVSTYTGATTISAGTVKLGVANALPPKSAVSLASGAKLDMGGFSDSIGALSDGPNGPPGGTIDNSTGTGTYTLTVNDNDYSNSGITSYTFSGLIENTVGTVALTFSGTNNTYLSGANTYAGATTVNHGTVTLGVANALPSASDILVANTATLDLGSLDDTVAALSVGGLPSGPGTVNDLYGTLTVSGNAATVLTQNYNGFSCIAGTINGYGTLVKGGTHAMAFRGDNSSSFGGTLTLSGGVLSVGAAPNRLSPSLALNVGTGALFQLDANKQTVGSLGGSGKVNLGGGILTSLGGSGSTFTGVIQNSELPGSSIALGNGLRGYYYTNVDMTGLGAVRDDSVVNIVDVQTNLPPSLLAANKTNQISVRWVGQVLTTAAGQYVFTTRCDDGARLWVNGTMLVDDWTTHGATSRSGTNNLAANTRYDIVMEYFNNTDGGSATLSWTPPGETASTLIPTANLFLPGPGSLVVGGGNQTLSGPSTYSGGTTVNGGGYLTATANGVLSTGNVAVAASSILELQTSGIIAPAADLILDPSTANVYLNFNGTNTIHGISFSDGTPYAAAGVYGAGANNPGGVFTGSGYLKVVAGPTVNALTTSPTGTAVYGAPLTLTATITPSSATGTVTFYDGADWVGSATLNGSGVASVIVSNLQVSVGTHNLSAVYGGDPTHDASTGTATKTISPATIVPAPVVAGKTYDGTTAATIASITFSGILPNDTNYVHLDTTAYTANFTDANVGVNKTVNISGLALTGSLASNYQLSVTSLSTTASITNRVLTLSGLTTPSRAYDANTDESFSGTAVLVTTNVVSPDSITLVTSSPVLGFLDKYVGANKTVVIVSGYSLSGSDPGNYVVALTNTASITGFPVTVSSVIATNRVYNGGTAAGLSGTPALSPTAFAGDDVHISATNEVANFTSANVGTGIGVTVTGYALYGNDATNYALGQPTGLTANITQASTTATITSAPNPASAFSPVTFTFTVTSTTPTTLPPTGTVTFYTNLTSKGGYVAAAPIATLVSNTPNSSVGVFITSALGAGTYKAEAVYNGDANFIKPTPVPTLNNEVVVNNACSQTNRILSVVNNGDNSFTLNLQGTYNAQYYVIWQTNVAQALGNWMVYPGSTNTVGNANGQWSITVNKSAPAFYRVKAVSACP